MTTPPSALNAIKILSDIQIGLGDAALAYWVGPNTILTLADARAFCDGIFWNGDKKILSAWVQEISSAIPLIKSASSLVWSEIEIQEPRKGETCASYELLFKDGLETVLGQTRLITADDLALGNKRLGFREILGRIEEVLHAKPEFKQHSREDLNHIAFGILLGYPDEAITESVLAWHSEDEPFSEKSIPADISGADYYVCPQPVYSYPRRLVNNPTIKAHEKRWSDILNDYYHSDFHKKLESNVDFNAKMKALGNIP